MNATGPAIRIAHKTCNLCEAMCGLRIELAGDQLLRIQGDPDDPLSRGAICAKAIALRQVQQDPDRLCWPLRRSEQGFVRIGWEEALEEAASRLAAIQLRDGDDAVGTYLGNPGAHSFGTVMYVAALREVLGSRNTYSASSLDQNPRHAACLMLYGNFLRIPVPDLDRSDFLLVLGANPVVSNGSLMSAPGFARRARALRARGGRLVVVDPRRSETAALADRHVSIEPGRDALLLAALIHTVLEEKLGRDGHLTPFVDGRAALARALAPFAPERVQADLGLEAAFVRGLARDFAAAPAAACYGRVGTCLSRHATLCAWLIDVLNLLTGNLDRPGGVLFPRPAADLADLAERRGAPGHFGDERTRASRAPTFNGERPMARLAEEILTPGAGRLRGLVTIAGNPCLSAPNGRALERAFANLELHVAIDFYVNETTRHADLILPPLWSLEHDAYEVLFHGFAVRNTARFSPRVIEPEPGRLDDWQILTELALRIAARKQPGRLRRAGLRLARRLVPGPRRALDWMLRIGPHGDGFRPWRRGLRLADLEAQPSGIDLGPLEPQLAGWLAEHGRRIDLAPPRIVSELARLALDRGATPRREGELLLIGRRDPRSNNSWLHNVPLAVKGRDRCTLQMHPDDAAWRGLRDGEPVRVRSRVGELSVRLEISPALRPGVVSLPHGWGHRGEGLQLRLAAAHPGVSCNELVDDAVIEPVVGNAVSNGVPVEVEADRGAAQA